MRNKNFNPNIKASHCLYDSVAPAPISKQRCNSLIEQLTVALTMITQRTHAKNRNIIKSVLKNVHQQTATVTCKQRTVSVT
jgi:hypothetical protein